MYLIEEFTQHARNHGNDPAITDMDGRRTLSYRQLDALSNRIAHRLLEHGVRKNDSVILRLPRTSAYIASEIALLKIGAVIVPLIPEYPDDRVSRIQKDCNAAFVVREDFFRSWKDRKQEADCPDELTDAFEAPEETPNVPGSPDETPVVFEGREEDRGMIVYTSGSAGAPKGILYTRGNIDAQIIRKQSCVKDIHPLVFAASATMSFCLTVTEYFRTLTMGGHIHMLSDEVRADADMLSVYFQEHGITSAFISPRILKRFVSRSTCLKRVFTIGEKAVNLFSPDFEIINSYGLSETAGGITEFVIDRLYENTPIGKPLQGIDIMVADPEGNEVEDGLEGQICVIGNLPCAYNRLPSQTEKVFRILPDGRSMVFTGDIGKKLPGGNLLYLNRTDWMIKIHGQRVEPGEIESVMNQVDGITGSVVKAFENDDDTMLLCGFYTESSPVNKNHIRAMLKTKLPPYMVPGTFVRMDAFPVNPNGKTDRNAIQKPDFPARKAACEKPENEIEEAICKAMQQVLQIDRVGREDHFFELGGNSINAVTLCATAGVRGLSPREIMLGGTPAGIAAQYREYEKNAAIRKPELNHTYKPEREYPLTLSNQYFFYDVRIIGEPIDLRDLRGLFRLDRTVDEGRLKQAIEDSLRAHKVYGIRFSPSGSILRNEAYDTAVTEVTIEPEHFDAYRMKKSSRKRDLLRQPMFDFEIVHVGKTRFLYMNLSHLVVDQISMNLLYDEISDRYEGKEPVKEDYDYFDVAAYEKELRGSAFRSEALRFFDRQFKGFKGKPAKASGHYPLFSLSQEISTGMTQTQSAEFLKRNGVSEGIYIQAVLFLTLAKLLGQNQLTCRIFHSGRDTSACDHLHGCMARGVFARAKIDRTKTTSAFLKELQTAWQDTVYYDVIPIQELAGRYPQADSCISLNYRGHMKKRFHLGQKQLPAFPVGYIPLLKHTKAWLHFDIDKLTEERLLINLYGEGYFSPVESGKIVSTFEKTAGLIAVCETIDDILKEIDA